MVRFDAAKLGNVEGRRLLHLQCHIGTDIGWARLGAEVTGIDISPKSSEAARSISENTGTHARFIVSELYDAPAALPETFDIVYTGVGAICWLPDIGGWADVVASFLEPGGRFYMREGHPVLGPSTSTAMTISSLSTSHISRRPSRSIGPTTSPTPVMVR